MIKEITVYADGRLVCGESTYRCALGPKGVTEDKKEGDGVTPAGTFPLRRVFYRSDRISAPKTELRVDKIENDYGWCTDPAHSEYNEFVVLPHEGAREELWREDHIYDIIVPIGYNDDPPFSGKGSAIFLHLAREGYTSTEGCVAVSLDDMLAILKAVSQDVVITIQA